MPRGLKTQNMKVDRFFSLKTINLVLLNLSVWFYKLFFSVLDFRFFTMQEMWVGAGQVSECIYHAKQAGIG